MYVADHKNHRVQEFTPDGEFISQFGSYGTGKRQLHRPSGVAVDPDGDVYVATGPTTASKSSPPMVKLSLVSWAMPRTLQMGQDVFGDQPGAIQRRREVRNFEQEWRFAFPRPWSSMLQSADRG